jgi:4-hydroxy-tetrahydrodipicolinate synthase
MRLRSLVPAEFRLLSGEDATGLAFLANGGDGCISTISNVAPGLCQAIYSNCRQGRLQSVDRCGTPQLFPSRLVAPDSSSSA